MELATAFGKGNLTVFQGNSVQFAEASTWTYGINSNIAENSTIGLNFIPLQRIINYDDYYSNIKDISEPDIFVVSSLNTLYAEEMTKTRIFSTYSWFSGVPRYDLVAFLEKSSLSAQIMQGEQEIIRADTHQSLPFRELVNVLDRISRPTEMEDIPLPFDPDDYPVV